MTTVKQRRAFDTSVRAAVRGVHDICQNFSADTPLKPALFFISRSAEVSIVNWTTDTQPYDAPELVRALVEQYDAIAAVSIFPTTSFDAEGVWETVLIYGAFPVNQEWRLLTYRRLQDGTLEPASASLPENLLEWLDDALVWNI